MSAMSFGGRGGTGPRVRAGALKRGQEGEKRRSLNLSPGQGVDAAGLAWLKEQQAVINDTKTFVISKETVSKLTQLQASARSNVLLAQGKQDDALNLLTIAIDVRKEKAEGEGEGGGEETKREWAALCKDKGFVHEEMGNQEEALRMYQKALALQEEVLGVGHIECAKTLNDVACVHFDMLNYGLAFTEHCMVLETLTETLNLEDSHPLVADTIFNLALSAFVLGDLRAASEFYQQVLTIREDNKQLQMQAEIHCNMGNTYILLGDGPEALLSYEKGIAIETKIIPKGGQPTTLLCDLHMGMGLAYDAIEEPDNALEWYKKAASTATVTLGTSDPQIGDAYYNMALIYSDECEEQKALTFFTKALDVREASLGANHPDTANVMINIAATHAELGSYDESLKWYDRALPAKKAAVGDAKDVEVGDVLFNIGEVCKLQENWSKAEQMYSEAHDIYFTVYGHDHEETVEALRERNDARRQSVAKGALEWIDGDDDAAAE